MGLAQNIDGRQLPLFARWSCGSVAAFAGAIMDFKLDVSAPFSDDEHTASDGPYTRVLKARKWLYLVAALAALHHYRFLHFSAFKQWTGGFLEVADWMMTNALKAALAIIAGQFVLLVAQLLIAYPPLLRTRLLANSAEALGRDRDQLNAAVAARDHAAAGVESMHARVVELEEDIARQKATLANYSSNGEAIQYADEILRNAGKPPTRSALLDIIGSRASELDAARKQLNGGQINLQRLDADAARAEKNLVERSAKIPERHPVYAVAEVVIDLLRVGAPLVFATVAVWLTFFTPPAPPTAPAALQQSAFTPPAKQKP